MAIRILLADDHQILREALRSVLESEPGIAVVAEASDGLQAVEQALSSRPDLIVMDVGMPGLDGIAATRRVLRDNPAIKVVALSTYSDQRIAQQMLEAGAKAYVVKAAGGDELIRAIRSVVEGKVHLCPEIAANLGAAAGGQTMRDCPDPKGAADRRLGRREREVLQLLIDGLSTAQIAGQLHIGSHTVERHRRRIMRKLGLQSHGDFAAYALEQRRR